MDRTACTEPQCLYKGALYLNLSLQLELTEFSEPENKNMCFFHCPFIYNCLYPLSISIYENIQYIALAFFLVISISFCRFESMATLVFIESFGRLVGIQLATVFCVSLGCCNPPSATGGDYPNRQAVRCLMFPASPAQSANGGVGRWERLENGWNKNTERGIRIKV